MHCAECETIDEILYETTTLWIYLPTKDAFGKLTASPGINGLSVDRFHSHGLKVTVQRDRIERFLTVLNGELSARELALTKILATDGRAPQAADMGKMMSGEVFVYRCQSRWLIDAIEDHSYETWFQPIVHASDPDIDAPFAREGLFRLRDRNGTLIPPGHVFKVAEYANLLFSIDLIARRSAVEAAARVRFRSKVFINFNPSSVYDPSYCLRTTAAVVEELGLQPRDIVFEITETHQATDPSHLKGILAFYRSAGFQVALDDIGSGYSGLNMLHEFRPDYVKLDMDLVRDVDTCDYKQSIVKHLLDLSKANGVRTVAEGVETAAEAAFLTDAGADYLQGYYFARPAPVVSRVGRKEEERMEEAGRPLEPAAL